MAAMGICNPGRKRNSNELDDAGAVRRLLSDKSRYCAAVFGRSLWRDPSGRNGNQVRVAESVYRRRLTAVRSGHGVGKSMSAGFCVIDFLANNPGSRVITTAPTWRQVEKILWKEIGVLHEAGSRTEIMLPSGAVWKPIIGRCSGTQWTIAKDWFALGLSTNQPEAFQGIRGRRTLVVFDEASGVPDEFYEAAQGILTGEHDRMLAIGNPTRNHGWFYDVFHQPGERSRWSLVHIDCERLPWVMRREPPPAPGLTTWQWVEDRREAWGRDSPTYRIRVRGDFDTTSDDLLIHLSDIEASWFNKGASALGPVVLGVDVGWTGDKTVFVRMAGDVQTHIVKHHNKNPMEVAGLVLRFIHEQPCDAVAVDADGLGGGVYARLLELAVRTLAFHAAGRPFDTAMFANARAEAYYAIFDALRSRTLRLLQDDDQTGELAYQPKKVSSQGRLLLMPKSDWARPDQRKRAVSNSPDVADALAIARWGQRMLVADAVEDGGGIVRPAERGVFAL